MTTNWSKITGPHKGKAYDRYEVRAKGFVLTGHNTKLGAQVSKMHLERKYPNSRLAIDALAKRNYRPFNVRKRGRIIH
ncbi:MAG TPA: hypothetical protein VMW50_09365 [Dehalococcoidia bacterium]|nr:hypothetical protein [Dehalococcoidia bacterium]